MRIYLVHWNRAEAEARAAELEAAGHDARIHWNSEQEYKWGNYRPEAVVISLDRLPSYGRAVAEWIWEAKKRRSIPIVFAGGEADKVKATREKVLTATFCEWDSVVGVLSELAAA